MRGLSTTSICVETYPHLQRHIWYYMEIYLLENFCLNPQGRQETHLCGNITRGSTSTFIATNLKHAHRTNMDTHIQHQISCLLSEMLM